MNKLSEIQIQQIVDFLTDQLQAYAIVLFGSAAKGNMRENSDVDLAYLSEKHFSPYELFMKAQELADILKLEVDLLDFFESNAVMRAQIVGNGKLLLDQEPIKRQYAFMRALKEYAMLNEERAEILRKRGYLGGEPIDQRHRYQQNRDNTALFTEDSRGV